MSRWRLDKELVEAAVLGGGVLGGGGGGSMEEGRRNGLLAVEMGAVELVDPQDLPESAILATASAVGAPAAKTAFALPVHYVRAAELLQKQGEIKIQGLVTSECGGVAATNGWVQAAVLGIPVVDAPCNGRAHPVAVMGSIGLHRVAGYLSMQAAVGGNPAEDRYVEIFVRGNLERNSALIRQAAVQAGGMVAVARNPVTVACARVNGAVGAIRQCIAIGRAMREGRGAGPTVTIEAACEILHGEIVGRGRITDVQLETKGGLDVGLVRVDTGEGGTLELTFWNEYMTLEAVDPAGAVRRIATFPDLMATFDLSTGMALSSALIAPGREVAVVSVPRQKLILGAGVRDPELLRPVEETVGKEVLKYVA